MLKVLKGGDETYEHQSLAATIAIMIGVDTGFRSIMEEALGSFHAVSMEDVTWEEFEKNLPDPKCFSKARKVGFKEVRTSSVQSTVMWLRSASVGLAVHDTRVCAAG